MLDYFRDFMTFMNVLFRTFLNLLSFLLVPSRKISLATDYWLVNQLLTALKR